MTPPVRRLAATLLFVLVISGCGAAAGECAVFKSTDRGRSWVRADAGLPDDSRINAFGALEGIVFAGTDSGIIISKDQALSWQPVTGTARSSGRIIAFAAVAHTVFAGTDGQGMLVSFNRGASWVSAAASPAPKVRCLLASEGSLFAGPVVGPGRHVEQ